MRALKVTALAGLMASSQFAQADEVKDPNIIIFYVDDLGWQDVEKLNDLGDPCPYETPNLIKLSEMGMNFSQGYSSAPTCAPSRAGIITGQHPAKIGFTHVTAASIPAQKKDNEFQEPFLGAHLGLDYLTLADALRANGYATGHFGKWHCGLNAGAYGFETFNQTRGAHSGMGDRTKDFATANGKFKLSKKKYPPFSEKHPNGISYPYDEVTEEALKFVRENSDEPFFLNLCHWMVHWPMLTRNGELLEYYCDKLGQPFPPKKGAMSRPGQQNPYFASMVTTVDWSLGRLMELLKTTDDPRHPGKKLIETTYIFFTSDNGGAEQKGQEVLSDNYPLKAGKKHTDEGGIRVPMVITGPGIPAGTESATMINQLDFFPTILTLTSSKIADQDYAELNGLDITPVLTGKAAEVVDAAGKARDSMFWHFPHNGMRAAIRKGDFKLYRHFNTGAYSLYRLYKNGALEDLEEQHDLSTNPEYAGVVKALSQELDQNLLENNAIIPYRNPKFKGAKLPSAKITGVTFSKQTSTATVTLAAHAPQAAEAYVLYYGGSGGGHGSKVKKGDKVDFKDPVVDYQIKIPAQISKDGHEVSALIPKEVGQVRFMIVDENQYCHFSNITPAK